MSNAIFQALRIPLTRNCTFEVPETASRALFRRAMAVIAFHSSRRIVSELFASGAGLAWSAASIALSMRRGVEARLLIKNRSCVAREIDNNPRARSAKLRVVERV